MEYINEKYKNLRTSLIFVTLLFFLYKPAFADECNIKFDKQYCDKYGYCFFEKDGKKGVYHKNSCSILADAEYESIEYFHLFNKSFIMKKDNKYGVKQYLPMEEILILPFEYDSVKRYSNFLLKVEKNGKFAIYDAEKNELTKFYDDIEYVKDDGIYITQNGKRKHLKPFSSALHKLKIMTLFLATPI